MIITSTILCLQLLVLHPFHAKHKQPDACNVSGTDNRGFGQWQGHVLCWLVIITSTILCLQLTRPRKSLCFDAKIEIISSFCQYDLSVLFKENFPMV